MFDTQNKHIKLHSFLNLREWPISNIIAVEFCVPQAIASENDGSYTYSYSL